MKRDWVEVERKLRKLYLENRVGTTIIAKEFGVSSGCVQLWLYRFKIPIDLKIRIPISEDHKKNISKSLKDKKFSKEHCLAISKAKKDVSISLSEEERLRRIDAGRELGKLSKGRKRNFTKEHREHMGESRRGKIVSKEHHISLKSYNYEGYRIDEVKVRRDFCINFLGGECCKDSEQTKLHFHHVDPLQKKFEIWKYMEDFSITKKEVEEELVKCLLLCQRCHPKLHRDSYRYLVDVGLIREYIDWYATNFDLRVLQGYEEKGVERHHIDMNARNIVEKNFLYLSKSDHNKLHQHTLEYLSRIDKVKDFTLDWLGVGVA